MSIVSHTLQASLAKMLNRHLMSSIHQRELHKNMKTLNKPWDPYQIYILNVSHISTNLISLISEFQINLRKTHIRKPKKNFKFTFSANNYLNLTLKELTIGEMNFFILTSTQ